MSSSDCLRLSRWTVSMRFSNSPPSKSGSGLVDGLEVLALSKGTWLGALPLSHFFAPGVRTDKNCVATYFYPEGKPMEKLVDAFLCLGPPSLSLREQAPAQIASDPDAMAEIERRARLAGYWSGIADMGGSAARHADNVLLDFAKPPGAGTLKSAEAACRQATEQTGKPQFDK
jgi:hypothetical protein